MRRPPKPPAPPEPPEPLAEAPEAEGDEPATVGRGTYRERKAESTELARLAKALVEMRPSVLAGVPLPDDVREAVEVARGLDRAPRVRQLRRVARLLRVHGVTSLEAVDRARRRGRGGR
jgi:ribosomal 50S subunit-associated protein YjgA (DUF615 family)